MNNPTLTTSHAGLGDDDPGDDGLLLLDGFDSAFLGIALRYGWPAGVAVYDRAKIISTMIERDGMTEEEAEEFFLYNIEGAWFGEGTPVFAVLDPSLIGRDALS